ncbi:MAG: hypothetical protein ACK58L_10310 [Planctomycetota bacterium]
MMDANYLTQRMAALEKSFAFHQTKSRRRISEETDFNREIGDRVDVLEYNHSRILLILQTLLEICRQKSVFTDAEFNALKHEIDLADGHADGVSPGNSIADLKQVPEPTSFFSVLRQIEKSQITTETPHEFLSKLQGSAEGE